jgi:glycosyltransferase involved in cell wall biosynthesis
LLVLIYTSVYLLMKTFTKSNIKVSVCICTKNNFKGLKNSLLAFYKQNKFSLFSNAIEFVIVDSSRKHCQKKIIRFIQKLTSKYHLNLKYFFSPKKGISFGRNIALHKSRGEYIYFLDDDIEISPNWLKNLFFEITQPTKPKIIYGTISPIDSKTKKYEPWIKKIDSEFPWILTSLHQPDQYNLPFTANAGIHRSVFLQNGPFNEAFASYEGPIPQPFGEDPEFFQRAKNHNIPFTFSSHLPVNHLVRQQRYHRLSIYMRYFDDGKNIFLSKFYDKFYDRKKLSPINLNLLLFTSLINHYFENQYLIFRHFPSGLIYLLLAQAGIIRIYLSIITHPTYYNHFFKLKGSTSK